MQKYTKYIKYASTHQNMQNICKNPKYAKKIMQILACFILFWKP